MFYVMLEFCVYESVCGLVCVDSVVVVGFVCVVIGCEDFDLCIVGQGIVCLCVVGSEVMLLFLFDVEVSFLGYFVQKCFGCFEVMFKFVILFDGVIVFGNGESQWIIGSVVCVYVYVMCVRFDVIFVGGEMLCVDVLCFDV